MEQFERIRRDHRDEGLSVRALAARHRVHRRTVRQALADAVPPAPKAPVRVSPALGPHEATVRGWLLADLDAPRKQRHTARRVWQRLIEEQGAQVAESSVRAMVAALKVEVGLDRRQVVGPADPPAGRGGGGRLRGVQGGDRRDRGEAVDVRAAAVALGQGRAHRLCQPGPGVLPRRARPGVRRAGRGADRDDPLRQPDPGGGPGAARAGPVGERAVRRAAQSHYGYDSFFCLPGIDGAHEKGGVEGEIGRFRRRHLTPVPRAESLAALNEAMAAADALDDARRIAARVETVGQAAARELAVAAAAAGRGVRRVGAVVVPGRRQGPDLRAPVLLLGARPAGRASGRGPPRREPPSSSTPTAGSWPQHPRSLHKGTEDLVLDHYLEILVRKPGALAGATALAAARASGAFTADPSGVLGRRAARPRRRARDPGADRCAAAAPHHARRTRCSPGWPPRSTSGRHDPDLVAVEARRHLADPDHRPGVVMPAAARCPGRPRRHRPRSTIAARLRRPAR